jgi:hypothetical protein
MCERLMQALGAFFGVDPARIVLGASATACWQGILDMIGPARVLLTDATWPGMHLAVSYTRTTSQAIIQVRTDIGGRRCDDPAWIAGAVRVKDACHSWVPDPTAEFTIFSFYPSKLAPSGAEGGVVLTGDPGRAELLRRYLYCGMRPGQAGSGEPPSVPGRKANMTDVAAALNLEALERAPRYMREVADAWGRMAEIGRQMELQIRQQDIRPYLFQVEVPESWPPIPELMATLRTWSVPSAWNFPPAPLLTLPCHPAMSNEEMKRVFYRLRRAVTRRSNSQSRPAQESGPAGPSAKPSIGRP